MKIFISTILLAGTFSTCLAQEGKILVQQDQKIDNLLAAYKKNNQNNDDYYQIQVGSFDKNDKAKQFTSEVEIDYPNLPVKIKFETPSFRVRVGRFKTELEAARQYREVRKKYPNAMILKPKKSS